MRVSSRSSTTTSGLCWSTSRRTSAPSVVQAATLMSGSPSSSARRPSSTMAWSSASRTRIMTPASLRRQNDAERRAPSGRAVDGERAAQHLHAVLDAPQPEVPAFHADVLLARQHALRVEPGSVVRHRELDARGPEGADEVADLAERALQQAGRLLDALLRRGVPRHGALEHLELRQGGEDVLHRPVVHVEHDPLELPLARGEEAARGGAAL